jgi:hypothetical protein
MLLLVTISYAQMKTHHHLLLQHVAIIDGTGAPLRANLDVLVSGAA